MSAGRRSWPVRWPTRSWPPRLEPSDPELEATAWDLEPLVDGEGRGGRREPAGRRRSTRAQAFAARYAGKLDELDSAGLAEAMHELARDPRPGRPRRHLRGAALLRRHRRPRQRRAAAAGPGAGHRDRDDAAVLRARVGGAVRRARRGAAGAATGSTSAATTCATCAATAITCSRARGEDPRREVAHRRGRLDAAVRGADLGDRGRLLAGAASSAAEARRSSARRSRSTSRSAACRCPTASSGAPPPRRSRRRSRPGCARARSCSTRCSPTRRPTTACAATRTGWRRATSPTRPATSPCRR